LTPDTESGVEDDINIMEGTVVAGKGTPGFSVILEGHLSDYFETRWEEFKFQRNEERFAAAAQKVDI
jgi:hypothetical protein